MLACVWACEYYRSQRLSIEPYSETKLRSMLRNIGDLIRYSKLKSCSNIEPFPQIKTRSCTLSKPLINIVTTKDQSLIISTTRRSFTAIGFIYWTHSQFFELGSSMCLCIWRTNSSLKQTSTQGSMSFSFIHLKEALLTQVTSTRVPQNLLSGEPNQFWEVEYRTKKVTFQFLQLSRRSNSPYLFPTTNLCSERSSTFGYDEDRWGNLWNDFSVTSTVETQFMSTPPILLSRLSFYLSHQMRATNPTAKQRGAAQGLSPNSSLDHVAQLGSSRSDCDPHHPPINPTRPAQAMSDAVRWLPTLHLPIWSYSCVLNLSSESIDKCVLVRVVKTRD